MKDFFFVHTKDTDIFGLFSDSRNTDRLAVYLFCFLVVALIVTITAAVNG